MFMLLLLVSIVAELVLYSSRRVWRVRHWLVGAPLILTGFATGALVVTTPSVWTILVAVVSIFRIINHLRVAEGRMHDWYLWHKTRQTSLLLGAAQICFLGLYIFVPLSVTTMLNLVVVLQLAVALIIVVNVSRNLLKTKRLAAREHYSDKELPTVSVVIPARNETEMLEDCLRSVISSNYPKLEVLVLDDCSHDRTPEIIKQFAQDGVRFVKGSAPAKRWLAKNQAYHKLVKESNGDLIMFCGADTRLGAEAVRSLVIDMLEQEKSMISVLPRRLVGDVFAAFVQPMRYWWELALPRRYFNRPPVLSTCWVIKRKRLQQLGGLQAVQHTILPEGYFARELAKTNEYRFVRSDDTLDVQTRKDLHQQRDTAIRMRYPQLRRRLELVLVLVLAEIALLLAPFIIAASGFLGSFNTTQIIAAMTSLLLIGTHVLIVYVTNPANVIVAIFNYPLVVLTELILGLTSMARYEFSRVEWKGRNICIPVMHTIPKLPSIK